MKKTSLSAAHQLCLLSGMLILVLISSVYVVYAKHLNRDLYIKLQRIEDVKEGMEVRWGQLQLEQSTFGKHSKIESIARTQLNMVVPSSEDIVMVKR